MNIIKVKEDLLPVNSRLNSLEKSIAESKQAVVRLVIRTNIQKITTFNIQPTYSTILDT